MRKQTIFVLAILMAAFFHAGVASAQKREVGFLLGAIKTGDREAQAPFAGTVSSSTGLTYQINYGQRMIGGKCAALYGEVLLAASPGRDVESSSVFVPRSYASLFLTPGLRLKIRLGPTISPYIAVGAGYARFSESELLVTNQPNRGHRGTNTAVYDFGGGVDIDLWRFVSVRGEIRDFVSGNPTFNVFVSGNRQHNILTSIGLVLRF